MHVTIFIRILGYITFKFQRASEYVNVYFDSIRLIRHQKILFLDIGSNQGQGAIWFSKFFRASALHLEMFEPNPNCKEVLESLVLEFRKRISSVNFNPVAVGVKNGTCKLYGLSSSEGGPLNLGASVIKEHNSLHYKSLDTTAIEVKQVDLSDVLNLLAKNYPIIVIKMDIEGAELEVLEHLLKTKTIQLVNTLYVEFHGRYRLDRNQRVILREKEKFMKRMMINSGVKVREWH